MGINLSTTAQQQTISFRESNLKVCVQVGSRPDTKPLDTVEEMSLVIVVDRSETMGKGGMLAEIKRGLYALSEQATQRMRIGIVFCNRDVRIAVPMTTMHINGRDDVEAAIRSLVSFGTTNIEPGLHTAMEMLEGETIEYKAIWLFTDGLCNAATLSSVYPLHRVPIISVFACGTKHDHHSLFSLSTLTQGMYYFVETSEECLDTVLEAIGCLLAVTATNLHLRVELKNGARFENGRSETVLTREFKELISEQNRNVVLRLTIPTMQNPVAGSVVVASAKLTFRDPFGVVKEVKENVSVRRAISATPPHTVASRLPEDIVQEAVETFQRCVTLRESGRRVEALNILAALSDTCNHHLLLCPAPSCIEGLKRDVDYVYRLVNFNWSPSAPKCIKRYQASHLFERSSGKGTRYKVQKQVQIQEEYAKRALVRYFGSVQKINDIEYYGGQVWDN